MWCGSLHLAFSDDVAYACTNIQQVAEEEEDDLGEPTYLIKNSSNMHF
jgi:hypothetical protein